MRSEIYTYKQQRDWRYFVDRAIDSRIVARLLRRSQEHRQTRRARMAIFAHEYIGIHVNQFGVYDRFALDSLLSFLRPILADLKECSALDIGANIGNHTIYLSDYFSAVFSFEPDPDVYDLLSFNLKRIGNCFPSNIGLGDEAGDFVLFENKENAGASSMKHEYAPGSERVTVKVKRLDDLKGGFGRVSFMKIDVEGFEPNVLRGGLELIASEQPIIVLEQAESCFVDGSTEAIELLKERGYRFCWCKSASFDTGWLVRRLNTIRACLLGASYDYHFFTASAVPKGNYETLICVPRRFQERLGFPD